MRSVWSALAGKLLARVSRLPEEDSGDAPRCPTHLSQEYTNVTERKSPRDAGMLQEIAASLTRCHEWLNKHALPPMVVDELSSNQQAILLENCTRDPHLLVTLGPAVGEAAGSQVALVRQLLRELIAAKQFDELPDLRQAATEAKRPDAILLDDDRTRKALGLLEQGLRGLALLREEAEDRQAALSRLCRVSDHPTAMIALVQDSESLVQATIAHARGAMGADPPRSLAEFKTFRAWWAARLHTAGFTYGEIECLLGYTDSDDPDERLRIRDAVRKNCRRVGERGGNRAARR